MSNQGEMIAREKPSKKKEWVPRVVEPSANAVRFGVNQFSARCWGCREVVASFHGITWREPGSKFATVAHRDCVPRAVDIRVWGR